MFRYNLVLVLFIVVWSCSFAFLWSLSLPTTASAAHKSGIEQQAGAAGKKASPAASSTRVSYLSQLHLHASLSEGQASMAHHTAEAEQNGYDILWWTDHMERQFGFAYLHYIGFENSLERTISELKNRFDVEQDTTGFLDVAFDSQNPHSGSYHGRCRAEARIHSDWTEGRLAYFSSFCTERQSLISEPELRLQVRLNELTGDAGFFIRLTLSSRADGFTSKGIPNILEYVPRGIALPDPPANVQRVDVSSLQWGQWQHLCLHPADDARQLFWEQDDLALYQVDLVFAARDGGTIEADLDTFRITLEGPTDLALFREQERLLTDLHSNILTHHVGMEVAGPYDQAIMEYSSRDHIVALYPDGIPGMIDYYRDPGTEPHRYPASGIETIHDQGGVAIIAHAYGVREDPISQETGHYLAARIVNNNAWNADGIEIGYLLRGRPLADFVAVWDELSFRSVFITGVAATDNHSVLPWDKCTWRWATWIRSPSDSAPDLVDAIRGGDAFFGDPVISDPGGDLLFTALDESYSMGDVVPARTGTQAFRIGIIGARAGDDLVAIRNSQEVYRKTFTSTGMETGFSEHISPGDFVRIEVRDPSDEPYLFSNPIYFVTIWTQPPPYRVPGP